MCAACATTWNQSRMDTFVTRIAHRSGPSWIASVSLISLSSWKTWLKHYSINLKDIGITISKRDCFVLHLYTSVIQKVKLTLYGNRNILIVEVEKKKEIYSSRVWWLRFTRELTFLGKLNIHWCLMWTSKAHRHFGKGRTLTLIRDWTKQRQANIHRRWPCDRL